MQTTQEADEQQNKLATPTVGAPADRDAEVNNAQTPPAGDIDPASTASSDATGQAGVNDRPGKDQAHPWNG